MVLLLRILILGHLLSILYFVCRPSNEIDLRLECVLARPSLIAILLNKHSIWSLVLIGARHLLILSVRMPHTALRFNGCGDMVAILILVELTHLVFAISVHQLDNFVVKVLQLILCLVCRVKHQHILLALRGVVRCVLKKCVKIIRKLSDLFQELVTHLNNLYIVRVKLKFILKIYQF